MIYIAKVRRQFKPQVLPSAGLSRVQATEDPTAVERKRTKEERGLQRGYKRNRSMKNGVDKQTRERHKSKKNHEK